MHLPNKQSLASRLLTIFFLVWLPTLLSCGGGEVITPQKKAPTFTSNSSFSMLDDRVETGYQAVAVDYSDGSVIYSISGGADGFDFIIDPVNGVVSFITAPDFENPLDENADNIYELIIVATDSNNEASQLLVKITISGSRANLLIPVVVHVMYQEAPEHESNISEEKILSQIAVLNKDYRKANTDLVNVPEEFISRIADIEIEFEMAKVDPSGEPTNGITRTLDQTNNSLSDKIYFSERGGQDAWPTDQYLNIWVYDGSDRHGNIAVSGRGQFPGGDPLTDGVIVAYQAFGTIEPLATNQELHLGRTATHEIGHWLNLRHIDGNYSCDTDDEVEDTPVTSTLFTKHPTYPSYSCGSSDMFMNFMTSVVADDELIMFTQGQKKRIYTVLSVNGERADLYENLTSY